MIDARLLEFTLSPAHKAHLVAYINEGSISKAAKATGSNTRTIERAIQKAKKEAERRGYCPDSDHTKPVPESMFAKRISTNYGPDGGVNQQWVIAEPQKEKQGEALKSFVEGLKVDMPQAKPSKCKPPKKYTSELMTGVFIGDAHLGMYAYGDETKHADFDSDIATQQLRDAIDYLVDKAEPTETGLLVDVGDFMHANGSHDTTFAGTALDVDTRHHLVMKRAGMVMRYMIDKMLEKHRKVVVCVARGNHNTDSAVAVQLMLDFYYEKDKRVNVLDTEGFYHYIEYGKWLIGVTHGDKQKPESLVGSMARDMSEAWGRTTHRLWATGHFHKEAVKTLAGCKHKVFAALPPPDSWHASHGFAGDGEMEMLTFRKEGGLYSSHVYNIPRPVIQPDVTI